MCRTLGAAESGSTTVPARELLPTNVAATHYDVTLEPQMEEHTFKGTVTVDLDVVEASSVITLHTLDLEMQSAKVTSGGSVVTDSPKITHDKTLQTSSFELGTTLAPGSKAQLEITFTGELNNIMAGFSRSFYKNADGSQSMIASTQMEPTDCRRVLPCFDEPSLKAQFTVTLIVDKHLTALSNMDVASETEKDGKKVITFNKTPQMSTYLLAVVIGELDYIESKDFRIPIRVYMPKGYNLEHGRFALELAAKTLPFYEKIFGIDFPLPKMDQVAIPEFAAGAMENWGLITYRVVDLVIDEAAASASHKLRVAEVVQHELAHQWFGNLVTMDWWEGLWLNEGFATWASWYSCNHFFPEWNVWEGYVNDTLKSALILDSLRSSHPIEVPIKKSEEVNEIFDSISYAKGSCVLRMLSIYLGEDKFLEGVRKYLSKHAYRNTITTDLWNSLADATGKPVAEIMETWTKKMGYPVVTVDETDGKLNLTQNRYLRTGDVKPEDDSTLYPVFLNVRTADGVNLDNTLKTRETTLDIPADDFYKINANQTGLYRTCYTPERLEKLGLAAKDGRLTVEDRAGLVGDAAALSVSGYQRTSGLLNLLKNFDEETAHTVWESVISELSSIRGTWLAQDPKVKAGLDAFQLKLVSPRANSLGWDIKSTDSQKIQLCKTILFSAAGAVGDENVVAAVKDMFAKHMAGDLVQANLRPAVLALSVKYGGAAEYDQVYNLYKTTESKDEALDCLEALGRNNDPELIKRSLGMMLTKDLSSHDSHKLLGGLRAHSEGVEAMVQYLVNNWDRLIEDMPPTLTALPRTVSYMTTAIRSQEQLDRVVDFFKDKDLTGFENNLKQSIEAVRSKLAWIERDSEDVAAWVKANGYLA